MKKILIGLLSVLCVVAMAGCNKQVFDWNLKFDRAYVKIGNEWKDIEVVKWTDYEDGDQIQLTLKDGTVLIVHAENLILYKGSLPKD